MLVSFSQEQSEAWIKIMDFISSKKKKTYVLAGYAGTGKSFLISEIGREIDTLFLAYTGKAANVLKEKGMTSASTIHSHLYRWVKDENDSPVFRFYPSEEICDAPLVIVDEYSMLTDNIINDLKKCCKKILFVGDPFQLPPINGVCSLQPDSFLTHVHRQALDSNIVKYATMVRNNIDFDYCVFPDFMYVPSSRVTDVHMYRADQVICGYNKTRQHINRKFRDMLGYNKSILPVNGDKLICLQNQPTYDLANGQIERCESSDSWDMKKGTYELKLEGISSKISCWDGDIVHTQEKFPKKLFSTHARFDYGYAITCHKSQGSEFDKVYLKKEPVGSTEIDKRRWLYTGITRAKSKLLLVD